MLQWYIIHIDSFVIIDILCFSIRLSSSIYFIPETHLIFSIYYIIWFILYPRYIDICNSFKLFDILSLSIRLSTSIYYPLWLVFSLWYIQSHNSFPPLDILKTLDSFIHYDILSNFDSLWLDDILSTTIHFSYNNIFSLQFVSSFWYIFLRLVYHLWYIALLDSFCPSDILMVLIHFSLLIYHSIWFTIILYNYNKSYR